MGDGRESVMDKSGLVQFLMSGASYCFGVF